MATSDLARDGVPDGTAVTSAVAIEPSNDGSLHPLRQRSFALFLVGSLVSWVGDWMDLAALNWAVLELTGRRSI